MLHDRIALVTGGSRGIGKAIADTLGAAGAVVIATATTPQGADAISERFHSKNIKGQGQVLDVTNPIAVNNLMTVIEKQFGSPAILVNNAAITKDNLLMRMKDEEWSKIIDTNLTSIYRLTKACLRSMMKARFGRIISIGSVVGSSGNAGQTNYATTKAGILGFTRSLAREVGSRGITVNVVAPGCIDTDMTQIMPEAQRQALLDSIPLGRIGKPEDVANVVLLLASEAGGYITGETIHVNGGLYMD